jgi:uncharacterized protein YkwD
MRKPGRSVLLVAAAITLAAFAGGIFSRSLLHSTASDSSTTKMRVLVLLNQERSDRGLHALTTDTKLTRAAQSHSTDMLRRGYFAHNGPQGPWDVRIRHYVHRRVIAEILTYGSGRHATPSGMVNDWMNSPSHRRIILMPELRRVGLGLAKGTYRGQRNVAMASADLSSP